MYPAVRELKKQYGTKVAFIVADIRTNEGMGLAYLFNPRAIPYFVMVSPTQVQNHHLGTLSVDQLRNMIEAGLR